MSLEIFHSSDFKEETNTLSSHCIGSTNYNNVYRKAYPSLHIGTEY